MREVKELMFTPDLYPPFEPMYCGKNGEGYCTGLRLESCTVGRSKFGVIFRPINTKGYTKACRIEIPEEAIPWVIGVLQEYVRGDEDVTEGHSRKCDSASMGEESSHIA